MSEPNCLPMSEEVKLLLWEEDVPPENIEEYIYNPLTERYWFKDLNGLEFEIPKGGW